MERAAAGKPLHVVVPASPLRADEVAGLDSERARWLNEEPAVSSARWRLRQTLGSWSDRGVAATGEVGAADPVRAVAEALRRVHADEVIVSTPVGRRPPWVVRDVTRRLRRTLDIPVVHVDGRAVCQPFEEPSDRSR